MRHHARTSVVLAYAGFVLVGIGAGFSGVLLLAQIRDYGVSRGAIGITFFTSSAGFVLASSTAGALIQRYGSRISLVVGAGTFVVAGLYTATHPPFVAFVVLQVAIGYANGMLESVLNAYLAALPKATTRLNRLHAFFGVGALIGPVLATRMLNVASWPIVWLVLTVAYVPMVVGFLVAYPGRQPDGSAAPRDTSQERRDAPARSGDIPARSGDIPATSREVPAGSAAPAPGGLLRTTLRQPAVLLGAALLAVYVGLELGMGNWAFSYLVQARGQSELIAGYAVSGYWLGLTLGRFLISPVASRIGASTVGLMSASLAGVTLAAALTWALPTAASASAGLVLLGFCLGPVFPTTMALVPQLTQARLVPTAIGVMNAGSVVGGSALPWLAGVIGQTAGIWTLLPFTLALAALQIAVWWPMAQRIRLPEPVAEAAP